MSRDSTVCRLSICGLQSSSVYIVRRKVRKQGKLLTNSLLRKRFDTNNLRSQIVLPSSLVLLHERERKHLLDTVVIRQEHDQAVDAHTPASRGRQAVLQGRAEVLVDELHLLVTLVLLARLLFEPHALIEGVVQLGVCVDNLLLADERLETFTETGVVAVVLGQRGHHLRVPDDEGRVDAGLLDELTHELVEHARVGERGRTLDVVLLEDVLEELVGFVGVQLLAWWELLAGGLLESRNHLDAPPGSLPVDVVHFAGLGGERGLVTAGDVLDETRNKILSDVHDVVHIGISPVELAGGELGVVGKIDPFVTELAAQLVHALKTSDNQHLQIQLGSNTHEQVHI